MFSSVTCRMTSMLSLQRQAAVRHQSLQQYLVAELRHLAERRSISEVLDELENQQGGEVGFAAAVVDLEEDRSRRCQSCGATSR